MPALAWKPTAQYRTCKSLERIIRDADRASKVVERVRGLAKNTPPQKAAVSVKEAVREVIVLTRGELEQNQIRLEEQFADASAQFGPNYPKVQHLLLEKQSLDEALERAKKNVISSMTSR